MASALRGGSGVALALFGLMLLLASVFAIMDPVGAKMADDQDPFGEPPSRAYSTVIAACSLGLIATGVKVGVGRRS